MDPQMSQRSSDLHILLYFSVYISQESLLN